MALLEGAPVFASRNLKLVLLVAQIIGNTRIAYVYRLFCLAGKASAFVGERKQLARMAKVLCLIIILLVLILILVIKTRYGLWQLDNVTCLSIA